MTAREQAAARVRAALAEQANGFEEAATALRWLAAEAEAERDYTLRDRYRTTASTNDAMAASAVAFAQVVR